MKLSVIVSLYHAYHFDDIIATYANQDAPVGDYEVLFMLTGREHASMGVTLKSIARKSGLNWKAISIPHESNCVARNKGAKAATGDAVLFIDGDQLIAPHLFSRHLEAHEGCSDVVGMGICNINISRSNGYFCILMPWRKGQVLEKQMRVDGDVRKFVSGLHISQAIGFADWHNMDNFTDYINVVGRNISIDRKAFLNMGMWDEELAYSEKTMSRGWEDLELGLRAHEGNLTFKMVPSWTVHIEHPSMAKDNGIDNIVKVVKKYPWFLDRNDWWAIRYNRDEIREKAGL